MWLRVEGNVAWDDRQYHLPRGPAVIGTRLAQSRGHVDIDDGSHISGDVQRVATRTVTSADEGRAPDGSPAPGRYARL